MTPSHDSLTLLTSVCPRLQSTMQNSTMQGPKLNYSVKNGLGEFLFNSALRFEENICQTDASTNESETYSSVKLRSTRVALKLEEQGICEKDFILFCSDLSLDSLVGMFGACFIGAKFANLDPSFSVQYAARLIDLVDPTIIFVSSKHIDFIENCVTIVNSKAEIVIFGQSVKYHPFSDYLHPVQDELSYTPYRSRIQDIAIVFFSKESSDGTSLKAVAHSHFSFLNAAYTLYQMGFTGDITLCMAPYAQFDAFFVITTLFLSGAHRVFTGYKSAEDTFRIIQEYKVSFLFLRSGLLNALIEFESQEEFYTALVEYILVTGSAVLPEQMEKLQAVFKESTIVSGYCQKEAGLITMFHMRRDTNWITTKLDSCGKIAAGVTLRVVNAQTKKLVGANEGGQIYVKSSSLLKGYYKEFYVEILDQHGFLKTGDIGHFDDDQCFYVNCKDEDTADTADTETIDTQSQITNIF